MAETSAASHWSVLRHPLHNVDFKTFQTQFQPAHFFLPKNSDGDFILLRLERVYLAELLHKSNIDYSYQEEPTQTLD